MFTNIGLRCQLATCLKCNLKMLSTRPGVFSALNCRIFCVQVAFNLSHCSIYSYQLHVFSRLRLIYADIENHLLWVVRSVGTFRHMMICRFRFLPLLPIITPYVIHFVHISENIPWTYLYVGPDSQSGVAPGSNRGQFTSFKLRKQHTLDPDSNARCIHQTNENILRVN